MRLRQREKEEIYFFLFVLGKSHWTSRTRCSNNFPVTLFNEKNTRLIVFPKFTNGHNVSLDYALLVVTFCRNIRQESKNGLNHFASKHTVRYLDIIFFNMSLNRREIESAKKRYKIHQIFLSSLNLWPFQRSKYTKIIRSFHFALIISFVSFQVYALFL